MSMPSIRVLQIEDNPLDARCVAGMLALGGNRFELAQAQTLAEGLAVLARGEVDVVLLDLTLPDSVGLETFVRTSGCSRDVPVVVVTGNDDERTAIEAVRSGAQDYLVKSDMTPQLLARALCYAVERGKLITALRDAMARLKTLRGLLPICSRCKKIRNDKGYWQEVEHYVKAHTEAEFSHGYCPTCMEEEIAALEREG
jgi:two-component system, cell cycle sensor histidine kinase and response regulator CckA